MFGKGEALPIPESGALIEASGEAASCLIDIHLYPVLHLIGFNFSLKDAVAF